MDFNTASLQLHYTTHDSKSLWREDKINNDNNNNNNNNNNN